MHAFPGWVALVAAIALVLAAWLAVVGVVLEFLSRRFRPTTK
jgi:hypothetical protein